METSSSGLSDRPRGLLEEIETTILGGALYDLIELTYAYDPLPGGTFFNRTLFSDFADIRDCKTYDDIYGFVSRRLDHYLQSIQDYQLQLTSSREHSYEQKIVTNYLIYVIKILQVVKIGLPFEIEKAGYPLPISPEDIEQKIIEIETLETELFGKMVRDDAFEISRSVAALQTLVEEKGMFLTLDERNEFQNFPLLLETLPAFRSDVYHDPHEILRIMTDNLLFQKPIPREIYVQFFSLAFAFYGIEKGVVVERRSAVYDGPSALAIPDDPGYATLTIQRVLELLAHEIETHYLVRENNIRLIGNLKGANNLLKEEGLSKFNEEILNGAQLSDFDISATVVHLALGEVISGKELQRFLDLYRKMMQNPTKATNQFLRRKRNYPLLHRGVQHKDITYSRGRFHVRGYLLDGGSYASLYYGKLDLPDIALLEEHLPSSIKHTLYYPQFLAERLLWEIQGKEGTREQWKEYLAEKYPFIDFTRYPLHSLSLEQEDIIKKMKALLEGRENVL